MGKSVIIIGAGIAGLSAGCYGQMNGYETKIFEMHSIPGGLCTSWKRKSYTFDGCIHWLVGSSPKISFYKVWEELGAIQDKTMVNHEEFIRFEGLNGENLIIYTNIEQLEKQLKEFAPEDIDHITEFADMARAFIKFDPPIEKAKELYGIFDWAKVMMKIMPLMKYFGKYKNVSVQDFANGFKNQFLRENFYSIIGFRDFPMIFFVMTLSWLHNQCAGYPIGGSMAFAKSIEKRYGSLGGEVHYGAKVEKVLVKDNQAIGVRLEDGTEYFSDTVISAADGHKTIFKMLDEKYVNEKITGYYKEMPIFDPLIQVSLGINQDLSHEPHNIILKLNEPVEIAGEKREEVTIRHYCFDPTLAPEGKSCVEVTFFTNYEFWKTLRKDKKNYNEEKNKIASKVQDILEERFPGIKEKIEIVDVATPITYERYTGNWKGTFEGWRPTCKTFNLKMEKTLPGLKNFYMIGQWVEPGGGLPPAATSGRDVVQLLCKNDKKKFRTSTLSQNFNPAPSSLI